MKKLLALLVAFGLIGFVAGCDGSDTKKDTKEPEKKEDKKDEGSN